MCLAYLQTHKEDTNANRGILFTQKHNAKHIIGGHYIIGGHFVFVPNC